MGEILRQQVRHLHPQADPDCEGCWGSGWLTAQVDNPAILEEAHENKPCDFVMKCDECDVFADDAEAIQAARAAGLIVNEHGVVTYQPGDIPAKSDTF